MANELFHTLYFLIGLFKQFSEEPPLPSDWAVVDDVTYPRPDIYIPPELNWPTVVVAPDAPIEPIISNEPVIEQIEEELTLIPALPGEDYVPAPPPEPEPEPPPVITLPPALPAGIISETDVAFSAPTVDTYTVDTTLTKTLPGQEPALNVKFGKKPIPPKKRVTVKKKKKAPKPPPSPTRGLSSRTIR